VYQQKESFMVSNKFQIMKQKIWPFYDPKQLEENFYNLHVFVNNYKMLSI